MGKKPQHTLRDQLQAIKLLVDEDLESYAERVQQLTYDASPTALDKLSRMHVFGSHDIDILPSFLKN